jgi:hypothetical protein
VRVIQIHIFCAAMHAACMGEMRNTCKILVGKCEGRRPLRNRHRQEDNIRMDLEETGWEGVGMDAPGSG